MKKIPGCIAILSNDYDLRQETQRYDSIKPGCLFEEQFI